MDLRQLQQQLGAAVFPSTAEQNTPHAVLAQIKTQAPLSNVERIQIYQNNIAGSHHHALIAIFQVTYQIVGARLFLQ